MKIVVAMACDEAFAELFRVSYPLVQRYCEKHNYIFVADNHLDKTEGDSAKIRLFRLLYATGLYSGDDIFCWIDTDALVMNSNWSIEDIVSIEGLLDNGVHVLYGSDFNGLNTGVWFARFTSHADHFLRTAQQASWSMGWSDQPGILQTWLQPIFTPWVKIVPGKRFNAMPYELFGNDGWAHKNAINNYESGDWICHFAGIEHQTRLELMRQYAVEAI